MSADRKKQRIPELLSPAGTLENAETAFLYGADAVYMGLQGLSLRQTKKAEITLEQLHDAIKLKEKFGKRLYVTLNILARDTDIDRIQTMLPTLNQMNIDGLIIADPGILLMADETGFNHPLHLSTQMSTLNSKAVKFWKSHGVKRIILARELSGTELRKIRQRCDDMELEVFVHGAMCMAYSGRCNLSLYMLERDANQGQCAQPCRWNYDLERDRSRNNIEIENDQRGMYILNAKDLNLSSRIEELIVMGMDSFKIEGRNKTSYYIANTVRVYRYLIDKVLYGSEIKGIDHILELEKVSHRPYSEGFYTGMAESEVENAEYVKPYGMVATVKDIQNDQLVLLVRDQLKINDVVEIITPDISNDQGITVQQILRTDTNDEIDAAHNSYEVAIPYNVKNDKIKPGYIVRKRLK